MNISIEEFNTYLRPQKWHYITIKLIADIGNGQPVVFQYSFDDNDSDETRARRKKDAIEKLKSEAARRNYDPRHILYSKEELLLHGTRTFAQELDML